MEVPAEVYALTTRLKRTASDDSWISDADG